MRLCLSCFVSSLVVPLLLACGDGSAPKVAEATGEGATGFYNDSASGGSAMGGVSGSTSAGGTSAGGTGTSLGGTPGTGASSSADPSGGRSSGGTGSGATDTGGQGSGGTVSGGTGPGGTSSGGTATGGRGSSGAGGRTSSGGSTGTATGGTAQGGTGADCTDDLNPEHPETPCSTWKEWGNCDDQWMIDGHICDRTCGRCGDGSTGGTTGNGGSTGSSTGGNSSGPDDLPNVTNGQQGWATRYWDCCKPSCGWSENASRPVVSCDNNNQSLGNNFSAGSACSGGNAHTCWRMAPWSVSSKVAYGFAAFNGAACGTCFQLDFSGSSHNGNTDAGSQSLAGKHMIVQVINTGGIGGGQFDLLVPGGGVGDFNACSSQWGTSDLGAQYGGFFLSCAQQNNYNYEPSKSCAKDWCQKVFSGKQDLLDGCLWYVEWAGMADNPNLTYGQVSCPSELTAAASG